MNAWIPSESQTRYVQTVFHCQTTNRATYKQIYGQTADNASNNDTMVQSLSRRLKGRCGPRTRVRCLCHVLNLCVKVPHRALHLHARSN